MLLLRILSGFVLPVALFTGHSWPEGSPVDYAMEGIGVTLIVAGAFGRVWAILYLAGRKGRQLVTTGPYSICRNPLYFFSLLLGLGVIASFENLLLLIPFAPLYLVSYWLTIAAEERVLGERFGSQYDEYSRKVPRFVPAFWRYRRGSDARGWLMISEARVLRALYESALFAMIIPLAQIVKKLHMQGILPVLWKPY